MHLAYPTEADLTDVLSRTWKYYLRLCSGGLGIILLGQWPRRNRTKRQHYWPLNRIGGDKQFGGVYYGVTRHER